MSVERELERRLMLWERIKADASKGVPPRQLREMRIYGGAQGIWLDKETTAGVSSAATGITVSVLHTGKHYSDDLSDDDLLYHYPDTNRSGKDQPEIEATKAAGRLNLPVFVLLPKTNDGLRPVRLGWICDWDDDAKLFLVLFGDVEPEYHTYSERDDADNPFQLTDKKERPDAKTKARPGQRKFKLDVLKRYGVKCCVCSIKNPELIVAAHIRDKEHHGSDDPRNGIPLCYNHHRAFDTGMFGINPDTLAIEARQGASLSSINATEAVLMPLKKRPHIEALRWRYDKVS